jgi:hypothetical protein
MSVAELLALGGNDPSAKSYSEFTCYKMMNQVELYQKTVDDDLLVNKCVRNFFCRILCENFSTF